MVRPAQQPRRDPRLHALGEEIWIQTGGRIDAFVHADGTAHSIHGATRPLRAHGAALHVTAVEPAESAVLSGGPTGSHKIEGIGIGFMPPLWEPDQVDEIQTVTTTRPSLWPDASQGK